jgi:hypothetical protein
MRMSYKIDREDNGFTDAEMNGPAPLIYISDTEIAIVKRSIILPFVISVIEYDKRVIAKSNVKVPDSYLKALDRASAQAFADISENRKELRNMNVKVHEVKRDIKSVEYSYYLRGYERRMAFLWNIVRAECEIYLAEILIPGVHDRV